ncbi:MAG: ABC transporter substrate-binding protein [Actinomycetia bacterium]|nr:ABC transporter substrate-binding protein [Actinomycetes bacterium]
MLIKSQSGPSLLIAGAALLLFGACGSSSEKEDGASLKLSVLCTVEETWCAAQTAAFQQATGVATTFVRMSSGDAATALRDGKDDPQFSVWWGGSADGYVAAQADGLLEAYVSPNAAAVPTQSKDADGFWTGIYVGALGFCSNTEALDTAGLEAPHSWDDLLDPALLGLVSMAHPASSGTAYTALWTVMTLNDLDEDATFSYFEQLDANIVDYTKSGSAPVQVVADSEAAVGIVFAHDCTAAIAKGATNLQLTFPEQGTGFETGAMAMINGGPDAEAARLWIDWALTAQAQEVGAQAFAFQLPMNPDAKVSELSVDLDSIKLVAYDSAAAGEQRDALSARFEAQFGPKPES